MEVSVDDIAPDFTLFGVPEGEYQLKAYRGQPVVLVFYPEDHTPVCTAQLRSYSTSLKEFDSFGAKVFGISAQGAKSHALFAEKNQISFPLLCDEEKEVAELYGVLGPLGFYRRSVFVLDSEGEVVYAKRTRAGLTFQPTQELIDALRSVS